MNTLNLHEPLHTETHPDSSVIFIRNADPEVTAITFLRKNSDHDSFAYAKLFAASPGLLTSLEAMVSAGDYAIEMIHATANPKDMHPVDWKGICMHIYAALNVIGEAREAIKAAKP